MILQKKMAFFSLQLIVSIFFVSAISWGGSIEEICKIVVFLRNREQVYEMVGGEKIGVWYKKNPKEEKYEPKLATSSGTGFIIKHKGRDYLVTAKHVAVFLSDDAEIVMNLPSGSSTTITFGILKGYKELKGAQWFVHPLADIAIHPLTYREKIDQLSIKSEDCPQKDKSISLLSTVYIVGFPLGLGVQDYLSPIAKKSQVASEIISINFPIFNPKLRFILLDQALAQGYSGAPVFCSEDVWLDTIKIGEKPIIKAGERIFLIGIVSAQLLDMAGGKISLVVPISYLWEIFGSKNFIDYEKSLPTD